MVSSSTNNHRANNNNNNNNGDDDDDNHNKDHWEEKLVNWLKRCIRFWKNGLVDEKVSRGLLATFAFTVFMLLSQGTASRLRRRRMLDNTSYHSATEAPLSLLYKSANKGQILSALLPSGGSLVYYLLKSASSSSSSSPSTDSAAAWKKSFLPPSLSSRDLVETLSKHCDHVAALPESLVSRLATPILAALPFVYLFFLARILKRTLQDGASAAGGGLTIGGTEDLKNVLDRNNSTTNVTFADVAGMPRVVAEIAEVVRYLSHPEAYTAVGARPPRAILLHGPPGSGKTLLAQAVAGQAKVPFFACSASEFVEVYVGRGAARVRTLFQQARQAALRHQQQELQKQQQQNSVSSSGGFLSSLLSWSSSSSPTRNTTTSTTTSASPPSTLAAAAAPTTSTSKPVAAAILFIDELDALAKARVSGLMSSNDEREQTLNQLLTELDGFSTKQQQQQHHHQLNKNKQQQQQPGDEPVITIIVIAATNRVDVLDPAIMRRFDRQIHVGYPVTSRDRKEILQVHARRVACGSFIDWDRIASEVRTGGCSGADLSHLVNEAALLAVREASPTIEQEHFDHAARRIQQMKWKQDHPGENILARASNAGIR